MNGIRASSARRGAMSGRFRPSDAWTVLIVRIALITMAAVAGGGVLLAVNGEFVLPPGSMLATWTILPVNLLTLLVIIRIMRRRGLRARDLLAPGQRGVLVDVLWGLLWLAVLYLPFACTLIGVFALLEPSPFDAMATAFANEATLVSVPGAWGVALAVVMTASFAPLNAPVEEIAFRGIAQTGLPGWTGIVVPSVAFGLQHAWFAATWSASVAMFAAFAVWGLLSAVIVHRQRRLLPILVSHVIVNLAFSAPPLVFALIGFG